MSNNHNFIKNSILFSFVFLALSVTSQEIEEVVVTGSRIETSEFEGAQPVIVVSQEAIARSQELGLSEVLRELPINISGSFYERSGSSAGSQAQISLRALGAERTLVLIDGRRIPASPKLGGSSANINMLPTAAVERVEILADGASAVYGADAVAGVVNTVLRKDFEGFNIKYRVAAYDHFSTEDSKLSIEYGTDFNDGASNIGIFFDYYELFSVLSLDNPIQHLVYHL